MNNSTALWLRLLLLVSSILMLRYFTSLSHLPSPLVNLLISLLQGNAFYINDRWSEISGHDKNAGMGFGWLDLVYHEDFESVSNALREAVSGNPLKLEFRYENKLTEPPTIRWVLGQDLPGIPIPLPILALFSSCLDMKSSFDRNKILTNMGWYKASCVPSRTSLKESSWKKRGIEQYLYT